MNTYKKLKSKWETLVQQGRAGGNFDPELLTPGRFCIHLTDCGGESMSCCSSIEATGYFDSSIDALGYLRFAEIPRILDFDSDKNKIPHPDVADFYLLRYEKEQRAQIDHLIGVLDRALISRSVSTPELCLIREEFNTIFSATNPTVTIHAWGTILETLSSPYFTMEYEDAQLSPMLQKLLDAGKFDEGKPKHLAMAKSFFNSRFNA